MVVINGKKIHSKTVGGGYFYVVNGKAHISAKKCPKNVDFASQTILWGIDDGVKNKKLFKTVHGKLKRYRTIIGENNSGDIKRCAWCGTTFYSTDGYARAVGVIKAKKYSQVLSDMRVGRSAGFPPEQLRILSNAYKLGEFYCSKQCVYMSGNDVEGW